MMSLRYFFLVSVCLCVQFLNIRACPTGCSCPTSSTTVSCNNAQVFPNGSFPLDVTQIYFYYPKMDEIPANAFKGYPNLNRVYFYKGSVDKISTDAFKDIPLPRIEFSYVSIGVIEGFAFRNLDNVMERYISFYYANITSINSYAFYGLEGIKRIYFYRMNIHTIHTYAFQEIRYCQGIDFNSCNIVNLKSFAFDYDPLLVKSTLSSSTVVNIGRGTLEQLTSVNTLTTYCDCNLMTFYKRLTAFSRNPIQCLPDTAVQDVIPGSMYECNRPEIPLPYADDSNSTTVDGCSMSILDSLNVSMEDGRVCFSLQMAG